MKTIAITMPEELDRQAAAEAARQGISKSELIRRGLAAVLPEPAIEPDTDLWQALAGFATDTPGAEPGEIDRVLYGS